MHESDSWSSFQKEACILEWQNKTPAILINLELLDNIVDSALTHASHFESIAIT